MFRNLQYAFAGDPVYYNPEAREYTDPLGYADKFFGYNNRYYRNTKHSSFYAYAIALVVTPKMRDYYPTGANGEDVLIDSTTIFLHEVGHVLLEKSLLNGIFQVASVVQEETGLPLPILTRMATHIPIEKPLHLGSRITYKTAYSNFYNPGHPVDREADLKPGIDPVVQFENLVKMSLNEQLGPQDEKYGLSQYYHTETGEYVKRTLRTQTQGEERMKDY